MPLLIKCLSAWVQQHDSMLLLWIFVCAWLVHSQRDLSVQQHPGGPEVQVLLLVRGSQELQQHQEHPKQQPQQTASLKHD